MVSTIDRSRSLAATHPELAVEAAGWDPATVTAGSRAMRGWRCAECGTGWHAEVRARARGHRGCPECLRVLHPPLTVTHPELAAQVLPPFDPAALTHGSKVRVRWRGPQGHEWEAPVANRAKGSGCPVCAHGAGGRARQRPDPGASLCETHPDLAAEASGWDPCGYRSGSSTRQQWQCAECGHEWATTIFRRARQGHGCPACARRRRARPTT